MLVKGQIHMQRMGDILLYSTYLFEILTNG